MSRQESPANSCSSRTPFGAFPWLPAIAKPYDYHFHNRLRPWNVFLSMIDCRSRNVLFALPENLDPWSSEVGLVTSLIPCSIIIILVWKIIVRWDFWLAHNHRGQSAVLSRGNGRQLHDLVRGRRHFGHLSKINSEQKLSLIIYEIQ